MHGESEKEKVVSGYSREGEPAKTPPSSLRANMDEVSCASLFWKDPDDSTA
jgi:hypothetical protein